MNKSKKIKLITSLSAAALVASAAPVVTVACTLKTTSNITTQKNAGRNVDITRLSWVKNGYFNVSTESEVKAQVLEDNLNTFNNNPGLKECIDV